MAWQLLGKNGAFAAKKAYILAIYPQLTPDKRKDFWFLQQVDSHEELVTVSW